MFSCAEYVKHMITSTSEKEKTNEKLKSDLDEKQRKLEREKEETAIQEGRSDPESVTSSLTSNMSDNTLSSSRHNEEDRRIGGGNNKNNKRKLSDNTDQEGSSRDTNIKKVCTVSSETTFEDSSGSGSGSGSGGNSGDGPSAHGCSISKTISTVSDMTGSNRGSISNNSSSRGESSDDVPTEQDSPSGLGDGGEQLSTSSISSDAAVANEKTSRDSHSCHKDVVFNNDKRMGRKRPPEEVTSLERSFELNYEEVFDKSNIPQLIASTSGKIVTWNECFAKATGYRRSEIERMTIFSLVKPENLANFFEIVAAALRPPDDNMEKNNETANEESTNNLPENDATATPVTTLNECSKEKKGDEVDINDDSGKSTHEETTVNSKQADETDKEENEAIPEHLLDYTAMTLPCIDFPAMRKRNQAAAADSNSVAIPPLHVTVSCFYALMYLFVFSRLFPFPREHF
jgi:PAS domain-containing protein